MRWGLQRVLPCAHDFPPPRKECLVCLREPRAPLGAPRAVDVGWSFCCALCRSALQGVAGWVMLGEGTKKGVKTQKKVKALKTRVKAAKYRE